MNSRKIPVVKVGQGMVSGAPEDFETHFTRRHKGSGRSQPVQPRPKLPGIKNPSMQDRVEELGLGEEVR